MTRLIRDQYLARTPREREKVGPHEAVQQDRLILHHFAPTAERPITIPATAPERG